MPYCAVKNCKNYAAKVKKQDGISYFHFPRNPVRCDEWAKVIARSHRHEYFKPKQTSVVCSHHFNESDMYVTDKGLRRLIKTALPNLERDQDADNDRLHEAMGSQNAVNENTMEYIIPDIKEEDSKVDVKNAFFQEQIFIQEYPSSSSNTDSQVDTPQVIELKQKLNACKNRIAIKNRKINSLEKMNKRLRKKNEAIKMAFASLKKLIKD